MVALLNKGDGAVLRGNGRGDDVFLNKADGGAVLREMDGVESKRALWDVGRVTITPRGDEVEDLRIIGT